METVVEPSSRPPAGESLSVKARVLAVGLLDIAIDLLLPTLVYLVLAPTGRSAAVRLTVGGFAIAAKSVTGSVGHGATEAPERTPDASGVRERGDAVAGSTEAPLGRDTAGVGGTYAPTGRDGAGAGGTDAPTGRDGATTAPVGRAGEGAGGGRRLTSSRVLVGVGLALAAGLVTLVASYAGADDTVAIISGTVVLGAGAVPVLLRNRRIDGFALLVLAEVALSVVLVLISTDPRFILVRPAFYTAVAGLYALATCWTGKPFMMQVTRPVAAGGDPLRAAAFDRAWFTSRSFRRAEIGMTAGLGAVLLGEAVLRVIAVYSRPEGAVLDASLLSQLPGVVLFVGYLVVVRVFVVPIASREVDAEMEAAR